MPGDLVWLYGQEFIEERNETHEITKHIPDYVAIGNDSGDNEFLLKLDGSETVYWQDPGCFDHPHCDVAHLSFSTWLANGCPLPCESDYPIPLDGFIWLISVPTAGMKDMFCLKNMLGETWSVPQMKDYLANVPVILDEVCSPIALHQQLKDYPYFREFLGFSRTVQGDRKNFVLFADLQ